MNRWHVYKTLLGAQLRYGRLVILIGWLALLSAGVGTSLVAAETLRMLGKIWAVLTLLGGMGMSVFLWSQDVRERRVLGWLHLPIRPSITALARLTVPVVVHLLVILPFLFCLPLFYDAADAEAVHAVERVFGIHAFSLAMSILIYFSEEVTVLVARWGVKGVVAMNVLFVGGMLAFVAFGERLGLPEIDSPPGMVAAYFASVLVAALTVRLYVRRSNYLLGVDACTNMPVDWSSSRG